MNILIIGKPIKQLTDVIRSSELLGKLYTATDEPINELPNIEYYSLDNLVQKTKALQVDVAINLDKDLINKFLVEVFSANRLNIISVNQKWLNLETSRFAAKKLMEYYSVNTAPLIKAPKDFPVVLNTDIDNKSEIVNTFDELVSKMEKYDGKRPYIEEYLDGETFDMLCMWDGKNIYYFNSPKTMTEVQEDRLYLIRTKLNFMFSDEKADFSGIFNIKLIWAKNDWYVRDFEMGIPDSANLGEILTESGRDFLYILNSAIYQKLNEM